MIPVRHAFALVLILVLPAVSLAGAPPLRTVHTLELEGKKLRVPLEIYLEAQGKTRIDMKVAGNLAEMQRALPAILSAVIEDTCRRRIGLEITEVYADADILRGNGRVQLISYACNQAQDRDRRRRLFSNVTAVDAVFKGRVVDNCVEASLVDLTINPSGLIGAAMNVTRLSQRVAQRVRAQINDKVNDKDTCVDLPDALKLLNTHLRSGGFRDFGGGKMGFVVKGTVEVTATNIINLLDLMATKGALDD
jgi:hypothetical protein